MEVNICTFIKSQPISDFISAYLEMVKESPPFLKLNLHILEYGGYKIDSEPYSVYSNVNFSRVETDDNVSSRAKNLSVKMSFEHNPNPDLIMICECDFIFKPIFWKNFIRYSFSYYYMTAIKSKDIDEIVPIKIRDTFYPVNLLEGYGNLILSKEWFLRLGGYDEGIENQLICDRDLYEKLNLLNLTEELFPNDTFSIKKMNEQISQLFEIEAFETYNKNKKNFFSIF